jgi:hypothetical protein
VEAKMTVTVDVINNDALNLLRAMETIKLIHLEIPGESREPVQAEHAGLKTITAEQLKTLVGDGLKKVPQTGYRQPLDLREARMEIAWASEKPHAGKSFAKYAGCLKGSPLFEGDSVAIQRAMRNEWQ